MISLKRISQNSQVGREVILMEWHINDLSVAGQFRDNASLQAAIEPLLRLRNTRPDLRARIFCSNQLYLRQATGADTLMKAISSVSDRNFRALAIRWFANGGPFWEDDRALNADDLFYLGDQDVTNQGIGEASRRILIGVNAGSFSFEGAATYIYANPLLIKHGLPEEVLNEILVRNVTDVEEIAAEPDTPPVSWEDMLGKASLKFRRLIFSEQIAAQLRPSPFHVGVARRSTELLGILDEIAVHTLDDGSLVERGLEILQMHFVGEKAAFTDESPGNKRDFENEMTFDDPSQRESSLFCPWHGKVKIGQFRIHFEWPRPVDQKVVKVLYIGPKITKH